GSTESSADIVFWTQSLSLGWHHLVGVRDIAARRFELYVDGVLRAQKTPTHAGVVNSSAPVCIGEVPAAASNYREPFIGRADDCRIYNRALSAAEITGIYAAGAGIGELITTSQVATITGTGGIGTFSAVSVNVCLPQCASGTEFLVKSIYATASAFEARKS